MGRLRNPWPLPLPAAYDYKYVNKKNICFKKGEKGLLRNSCKTNKCMALFSYVMTLEEHPDKMTRVAFVSFEG